MTFSLPPPRCQKRPLTQVHVELSNACAFLLPSGVSFRSPRGDETESDSKVPPSDMGPLFRPSPSRLENMMATAERLPFSWRDVENLPDLARLRLVLDILPDAEIVAALEAGRGRGRNDYPVRAMWRALIAGVVFQHPTIQSLLRELGRNPSLLEICGASPAACGPPGRVRATPGCSRPAPRLGRGGVPPRAAAPVRHPTRPTRPQNRRLPSYG